MTNDFIPWLALYSLAYRGQAQRYGFPQPEALPDHFRPWTAEEAVARLVADKSTRASHLRAMGMAQLARGADAPEFLASPRTQALLQKLIEPELARLPHMPPLGDALSVDLGPQERFLKALHMVLPDNALLEMDTQVTFCTHSLVSTVHVEALIDKPVAALIGPSDPRDWHTSFPSMWTHSETIDPLPDFADRDAEPVPVTRGVNYDSPFFEEVRWVAPGSMLTLGTIRNVLQVRRDATPPGPLGFSYRLLECLSVDFTLEGTFQGGIDRDSGFARFHAVDGDRTRLEVEKSIRFTEPAAYRQFINMMSCVNTTVLLEMLVALAAN